MATWKIQQPHFPQIVMAVVKRSPVASEFLFRAFNHALRRRRAVYTGTTYFGAQLSCNLDDLISKMIFYFGFWEPNNSAVIAELLKPGDVFVDVGANIGYYTLLASMRVGERGKVVAVEAAPAIFEQLSANVSANAASNLRLVNCAVSDEPGELTIYGGTKWNRGATSTIPNQAENLAEARIAALPLDEILTSEEMSRVALIKIDIEGGELPVLRRVLKTLDRYPRDVKILVEMAPNVGGEALAKTFDAFLAAGFAAFTIENEYTTEWYMGWRKPQHMLRVEALPPRQTDVLFMRMPDAAIVAA
jgi:FkbM family methyltransferase